MFIIIVQLAVMCIALIIVMVVFIVMFIVNVMVIASLPRQHINNHGIDFSV